MADVTCVVVRTVGPPAAVTPAVREEVSSLARGVAVLGVREFSFYQSRSVAGGRLVTMVTSAFAVVSLVLALVGVYGLFAYSFMATVGCRLLSYRPPGEVPDGAHHRASKRSVRLQPTDGRHIDLVRVIVVPNTSSIRRSGKVDPAFFELTDKRKWPVRPV